MYDKKKNNHNFAVVFSIVDGHKVRNCKQKLSILVNMTINYFLFPEKRE